MKPTSQSYKELGIPYFKEVFDLLDDTFKSKGIPYYLLGATAISLELLKDNIRPSRGTKDIDFAIMLSSYADYQGLIKVLLGYKNGFFQYLTKTSVIISNRRLRKTGQ